ncbi:MAG: HupE/UreJ family protein [Beijerinckiaceae bacterium]|nr:HupE/UreJ family protein [Beijerinckiaceae bacterium]
MLRPAFTRLAVAAGLTLLAAPAFAHDGHGGGFAAGFLHPVGGADHVLAMLAVGLWAAFRGGNAIPGWPAAFVAAMLAGFALAPIFGTLPGLEAMITSTVILLGGALALGFRAPVAAGATLIALAGAVHGYAHGLEMEGNALAFGSGFALATAALHGAGIAFGLGLTRLASSRLLQAAGGLAAAAGLVLAMA